MSCSDLLPYTVPVVINTRPVERAAVLTHHLKAAGFSVVDIPMLKLQDRALSDSDVGLMRRWLAGDYKALVMVSPTAATSGLAVWQTLTQQNKALDSADNELGSNRDIKLNLLTAPSHLIAVGTATAKVLQQAQLPVASYEVLQPTIANNEGMLAMPEIEQLQAGDKLLIWRGLGGRQLLVDTLRARGVHIDSIAWYERMMPDDAKSRYHQWSQQFNAQHKLSVSQSKPVVIISSGTAFEHWTQVVSHVQANSLDSSQRSNQDNSVALSLVDFNYVVLGARLAEMVAEQHLSYYRVEDLSPATILAAIKH